MARQPKAVEGVFERVAKSGIWSARYRVNGKLIRKSFGTNRAAAVEWVERARTVRRTGEGVLPATATRPVLTLHQLAAMGGDVKISELCDLLLQRVRDRPDKYQDQVNPPYRISLIRNALGGTSRRQPEGA